jgi:hypothetical protein
MSFMTIELMEWTMSETQATNLTQYGHDQVVEPPAGWSVEPAATVATVTGGLLPPPLPSWAAPVGLPRPLPLPVAPPDASDAWPVNVAVELTSLPPGWHALSSEHTGTEGAGFEHIVIGPAGVFTVTSTSRPEGLRNSQFEADRATRLLDQAGLVDIQVRGVIVSVGAELTLQDDSDVIVATANDICRTLRSLPTTLTPLQVQSVHNIAERSETWIERVQPKG